MVTDQELYDAIAAVHAASEGWLTFGEFCIGEHLRPIDELRGEIADLLEDGELYFHCPGECDIVGITLQHMLLAGREAPTASKDRDSAVRTKRTFSLLISPSSQSACEVLNMDTPLATTLESGVVISVLSESVLVGVAAIRDGNFSEHAVGAMTGHPCVQVDFTAATLAIPSDGGRAIAESFLFELSSRWGIDFDVSNFFDEISEESLNEHVVSAARSLRELEAPNEAMRLYVAAMQVNDSELRYLSFFKVLEFFGPIALNMVAADTLRKKLDLPDAAKSRGQLIREVFQLAKSYDTKRNEKDMMRLVLRACIDIVGLSSQLPNTLRQELSHDMPEKDIDHAAKEIAEVLCATRNQVAHAKSMYQPTGRECKRDELAQLTKFVQFAAQQAIRWYNRLPDHQREIVLT